MDTKKLDAAIGAALLDAGAGYSFERREAGPNAIAYIITYGNQEIGRVRVTGTEIKFSSFHAIDNQELDSRFRDIARQINEELERAKWGEEALSKAVASNLSFNGVQPWQQITDYLWDRKAVEMWWGNYINIEIGRAVHVSPRRVTNRLSELRKIYGEGVVPTDKQRRKRRI